MFTTGRVGTVLDLGAGTGKRTELLVPRAERVIAVEPSEAMLDQLRPKLPSVEAIVAPAEAIPLPDSSCDLVAVAQAFHWFDREPACREIARVLRPGGTLALLWNMSDPRCVWDVACGRIAHPRIGDPLDDACGDDPYADPEPWPLTGFVAVRGKRIAWREAIGREHYLRRWATVSSLITASSDERARMLGRMSEVLDADPQTAARTTLPLRQLTEVFVYRTSR